MFLAGAIAATALTVSVASDGAKHSKSIESFQISDLSEHQQAAAAWAAHGISKAVVVEALRNKKQVDLLGRDGSRIAKVFVSYSEGLATISTQGFPEDLKVSLGGQQPGILISNQETGKTGYLRLNSETMEFSVDEAIASTRLKHEDTLVVMLSVHSSLFGASVNPEGTAKSGESSCQSATPEATQAATCCSGWAQRGQGWGTSKSICCYYARADANGLCNNQYCYGCCNFLQCDSACGIGDYGCFCGQTGYPCKSC